MMRSVTVATTSVASGSAWRSSRSTSGSASAGRGRSTSLVVQGAAPHRAGRRPPTRRPPGAAGPAARSGAPARPRPRAGAPRSGRGGWRSAGRRRRPRRLRLPRRAGTARRGSGPWPPAQARRGRRPASATASSSVDGNARSAAGSAGSRGAASWARQPAPVACRRPAGHAARAGGDGPVGACRRRRRGPACGASPPRPGPIPARSGAAAPAGPAGRRRAQGPAPGSSAASNPGRFAGARRRQPPLEPGDPLDQGGDAGVELRPGQADQRDLERDPGVGRLAHLDERLTQRFQGPGDAGGAQRPPHPGRIAASASGSAADRGPIDDEEGVAQAGRAAARPPGGFPTGRPAAAATARQGAGRCRGLTSASSSPSSGSPSASTPPSAATWSSADRVSRAEPPPGART